MTFITLRYIITLESHLEGFLCNALTMCLQTTVKTRGINRKVHHFRNRHIGVTPISVQLHEPIRLCDNANQLG